MKYVSVAELLEIEQVKKQVISITECLNKLDENGKIPFECVKILTKGMMEFNNEFTVNNKIDFISQLNNKTHVEKLIQIGFDVRNVIVYTTPKWQNFLINLYDVDDLNGVVENKYDRILYCGYITLLLSAIKTNDEYLLKLLLKKGVELHQTTMDEDFIRPILMCIKKNNYKFAKLLIEHMNGDDIKKALEYDERDQIKELLNN